MEVLDRLGLNSPDGLMSDRGDYGRVFVHEDGHLTNFFAGHIFTTVRI